VIGARNETPPEVEIVGCFGMTWPCPPVCHPCPTRFDPHTSHSAQPQGSAWGECRSLIQMLDCSLSGPVARFRIALGILFSLFVCFFAVAHLSRSRESVQCNSKTAPRPKLGPPSHVNKSNPTLATVPGGRTQEPKFDLPSHEGPEGLAAPLNTRSITTGRSILHTHNGRLQANTYSPGSARSVKSCLLVERCR
jgi:hypothetical protein